MLVKWVLPPLSLYCIKKSPDILDFFGGGDKGTRPAALGQCRRQPGELKNHSLDGFLPRFARPFPSPPLSLYCIKKSPETLGFFDGGDKGTRTHFNMANSLHHLAIVCVSCA